MVQVCSLVADRGLIAPSNAALWHQAVKSDAPSRPSMVGDAAEYNNACVNTLRRSLDGYQIPGHQRGHLW